VSNDTQCPEILVCLHFIPASPKVNFISIFSCIISSMNNMFTYRLALTGWNALVGVLSPYVFKGWERSQLESRLSSASKVTRWTQALDFVLTDILQFREIRRPAGQPVSLPCGRAQCTFITPPIALTEANMASMVRYLEMTHSGGSS
jgi:hypothetical protein